jgi:hypothetical protein
MRVFNLKDDIYHQPITILVGNNDDEVKLYFSRRYAAKLALLDKLSCSEGAFFYFKNVRDIKTYFLWVRFFKMNPEGVSLIAHELYHGVHEIAKEVGVKDRPGGEALAYYFNYVLEQALNKLARRRKR